MIKGSFIIRSTVSSEVLKYSLFKGFAIAFFGILGLLLGGIFFTHSSLQDWGFYLFLMSFLLISYGLLPFRQLCRLQLKPDELSIMNGNELVFYSNGKKIVAIPLHFIAKMDYIDHRIFYGIAVWLKSHHYPNFDQKTKEVANLEKKGKQFGGDFFFSYFNRRAFHELVDAD